MLKFAVESSNSNKTQWKVILNNNITPTVGHYIQAIKNAICADPEINEYTDKMIVIYKNGILTGAALFKGQLPFGWMGNPNNFWGSTVANCQMIKFPKSNNCIFCIQVQEEEEVTVTINPFLPRLLAAAAKKINV